jgi:hypothetical protein
VIAAAVLALVLAVATAWRLASARGEYLPIAVTLSIGLLVDFVGELIRPSPILSDLLPWPSLDFAPRPYTGFARVLYHTEQTGWLAWICAVVAVALRVLARAPRWPACAVAVCAHVAHVALYPWLRGERLAMVLRFEQALAVALLAWCVACWRRSDRAPEHAAALALVIAEIHVLLFSFSGSPFALWPIAQIVYTAAFCWLTVMHVRWSP